MDVPDGVSKWHERQQELPFLAVAYRAINVRSSRDSTIIWLLASLRAGLIHPRGVESRDVCIFRLLHSDDRPADLEAVFYSELNEAQISTSF